VAALPIEGQRDQDEGELLPNEESRPRTKGRFSRSKGSANESRSERTCSLSKRSSSRTERAPALRRDAALIDAPPAPVVRAASPAEGSLGRIDRDVTRIDS
jgi:hypothetical protein